MEYLFEVYKVLGVLVFAYMSFWFFIGLWFKRNDVADIAWGLGFLLVALASFTINKSWSERSLLVLLLVTLWSVRLSFHIWLRNRNKPEDYRYETWRKNWGKWFIVRSYFQVYILQGIFLLIISSPVVLINIFSESKLGYFDYVGLIIWLIGFFFESVGDAELSKFVADSKNQGKLMTSGLWRYTRHPNYFGEVTQWWGIYLIALSVPLGYLGFVGPFLITYLILFVSGVPLLENKMAKHPDFEEYKNRTSMFFPLPPKSS